MNRSCVRSHHEQRGKTEPSRCGSSDGAPVAVERTPVTAAPRTPTNTDELGRARRVLAKLEAVVRARRRRCANREQGNRAAQVCVPGLIPM